MEAGSDVPGRSRYGGPVRDTCCQRVALYIDQRGACVQSSYLPQSANVDQDVMDIFHNPGIGVRFASINSPTTDHGPYCN